jgi:hypothetical protein
MFCYPHSPLRGSGAERRASHGAGNRAQDCLSADIVMRVPRHLSTAFTRVHQLSCPIEVSPEQFAHHTELTIELQRTNAIVGQLLLALGGYAPDEIGYLWARAQIQALTGTMHALMDVCEGTAFGFVIRGSKVTVHIGTLCEDCWDQCTKRNHPAALVLGLWIPMTPGFTKWSGYCRALNL